MDFLIQLGAALVELMVDEIWPRNAPPEAPQEFLSHMLHLCVSPLLG